MVYGGAMVAGMTAASNIITIKSAFEEDKVDLLIQNLAKIRDLEAQALLLREKRLALEQCPPDIIKSSDLAEEVGDIFYRQAFYSSPLSRWSDILGISQETQLNQSDATLTRNLQSILEGAGLEPLILDSPSDLLVTSFSPSLERSAVELLQNNPTFFTSNTDEWTFSVAYHMVISPATRIAQELIPILSGDQVLMFSYLL